MFLFYKRNSKILFGQRYQTHHYFHINLFYVIVTSSVSQAKPWRNGSRKLGEIQRKKTERSQEWVPSNSLVAPSEYNVSKYISLNKSRENKSNQFTGPWMHKRTVSAIFDPTVGPTSNKGEPYRLWNDTFMVRKNKKMRDSRRKRRTRTVKTLKHPFSF